MKFPTYKEMGEKVAEQALDEYVINGKTLREWIKLLSEQEPISVSVSEKEPDEISEEVTLRFFRNSLKVRWQDMVIYNVEWLKKNWQMEMDIVCGVKPCDDVVSRQAVLDAIRFGISNIRAFNDTTMIRFYEHENEALKKAIERVNELPPVRSQEQTGHWSRKTKVDAYDIAGVKTWGIKCQCDKCDFTTIVVEDFGYYKFCPNCGARMVEPQESEEKE